MSPSPGYVDMNGTQNRGHEDSNEAITHTYMDQASMSPFPGYVDMNGTQNRGHEEADEETSYTYMDAQNTSMLQPSQLILKAEQNCGDGSIHEENIGANVTADDEDNGYIEVIE